MYNQVIAPLARGYGIAANILVVQALAIDAETTYFNGIATTALGIVMIGTLRPRSFSG